MNIALTVISRQEERYLDEWITYHFNLGISHIYFLDNNDKTDDKQKELVKKYKNLTYIDIRGFTFSSLHQDIQMYFYKKVFDDYKSKHDWMLFLDVDEFFTLENKTITEFFEQSIFNDTAEILFNWKCYNDSNLVYDDGRPVLERFIEPFDIHACYTPGIVENEFCKCAVNCKYDMRTHQVHSAVVNGNTKNALGQLCSQFGKQTNIIHKEAYIRHYSIKTIEEYIKNRILKKRLHCGNSQDSTKSRMDRFFNVCKHTEEKDKIAEFILRGNR